MTGRWSFTVDCPRCANNLQHVTGSRTQPHANLESKAVAYCPQCRDTFILTLTMRSETNRRAAELGVGIGAGPPHQPIPHGTVAGYRAHIHRHDTPCPPCKAANALRRRAEKAGVA